jgi:Zn-dependent M28 family amino/carboxypeptidase
VTKLSLLFLVLLTFTAAQDTALPGKHWWSHVEYLASDSLEGRLTGTAGYQKAADYVADQFKADGLVPAGTHGYFQPVKFDVQRIVAADSSLRLRQGQSTQTLSLGEDAILGSRLPQPRSIKAPLLFAGYGLHIPEASYDDFKDLDIHGKIIVYINGGPSSIAGPLKANARSAQEFIKFVAAQGALGVVSIPNPKSMDIPWSRMELSASQPGMRLDDPALQDSNGPLFTAAFNPAHAGKLFEGSGHTLSELLALADAGQPLPRFALPFVLEAEVTVRNEVVESPNIVAVFPGTDPQLKNEYVVYSAHLDHLGIGEPIDGDKIYNGAMDNASGVASLLEVAGALHQWHAKLKRSVLFVVVCAEEKGLLGSRYFAAKPTVSGRAMVADLNTDMFLPIMPLNYLVVYGGDESTLGDDIKAVAAPLDVQIVPDRQPDRNVFIRSDQYNFIRAGLPSLMPAFGSIKGSPEEKAFEQWLTHRYHAPSDDISQPVDLAAADKFNRLMLNLTVRVADEASRPAWKDSSFFRRFGTR